MYTRKKLPTSQYELSKGSKNEAFGRSNDVRRDDDTHKSLKIGLYDLDFCIKWYFENVIKPKIDDFGKDFNVPVQYGSPEKWKNIQEDGFLRDHGGVIQAPLISYRRTSITKNRELGNKIDANYPQIYRAQKMKYTKENKYDQFSVLTNTSPTETFINTIIPEYVDLTYEVVVWTDFVEQMNSILESIVYAEGSYWGEPDRFKFRAKIDDLQNVTDLLPDSDRLVRTSFNVTLFGYLVPDAMIKSLSKHRAEKTKSTQRLNTEFGLEDTTGTESVGVTTQAAGPASTTQDIPSNPTVNPTSNTYTAEQLDYLNTNKQILATTINLPNIVQFPASFLSAPSGISSPTNKDDFMFFINGKFVEPAAVTSFVDSGSNVCTLTLDIAELGYTLSGSDEIVAAGKFA